MDKNSEFPTMDSYDQIEPASKNLSSNFPEFFFGSSTLEFVFFGRTMFWNLINFHKILEKGKSTNYIFENIFEPNNTPNCGRIEILRDCGNPFLRLDSLRSDDLRSV